MTHAKFFNGMTVSRISHSARLYETTAHALNTCMLTSGGQSLRTGDHDMKWHRGQVVTTLPGASRSVETQEPISALVVSMPDHLIRRHHDVDHWVRSAGNGPWVGGESCGDQMTLSMMMSASRLKEDDDPLLVEHVFDGLRQRLAGNIDGAISTKLNVDPASIKKAMAYIDGHMNKRFSLTELADSASLSPNHFSRVFKRALGITPFEYVMRKRLASAKSLLARDMSISEVAYRTGFASQSHMTRCFNEHAGITPKVYRRMGRGAR